MSIAAHHLVDEVMRHRPATIRVFLIHGMRCVGCPIGCFHTVDDACREHGVDLNAFLADLHLADAPEPLSDEAEGRGASEVNPSHLPPAA